MLRKGIMFQGLRSLEPTNLEWYLMLWRAFQLYKLHSHWKKRTGDNNNVNGWQWALGKFCIRCWAQNYYWNQLFGNCCWRAQQHKITCLRCGEPTCQIVHCHKQGKPRYVWILTLSQPNVQADSAHHAQPACHIGQRPVQAPQTRVDPQAREGSLTGDPGAHSGPSLGFLDFAWANSPEGVLSLVGVQVSRLHECNT